MNTSEQLFAAALKAFKQAYTPYSGFPVGAAVLSTDNHIYSGCNVENISYPVGTCAEAGAIAAMLNGGDNKIAEILIYADSKALISPCGACRQRIAEFASADTKIHLADKSGIKKTFTLEELLPHNFKAISNRIRMN